MFFIPRLAATCFLLLALPVVAEPVRLMAASTPPYVDRSLPEQGLAVELVRHIYSRTDYEPKFTIENWSRAIEGVRVGVYDALAVVWYSEERNKDFLFSTPYLGGELIIIKRRANHRRYYRLQDLAGARLGVQTDYAYDVDFSVVPGLQLVEENHLIQNLLKLLQGEVDFVIGDRRTMSQQIHEFLNASAGEFKIVDINLPQRPRHVAASRDVNGHEDMIKAFNAALDTVRQDGSYDAIIKKWDDRYSTVME